MKIHGLIALCSHLKNSLLLNFSNLHVFCDPVSRRKNVVNAGAVVVGAENRRPGKSSDIILAFGRKGGAFFCVLSGSKTKRHGQSVDSTALRLNVGGVFIPDSGIEGFITSDFPVGADSGFEEKAEQMLSRRIAGGGEVPGLYEFPEKDLFDFRFSTQGTAPFGVFAVGIDQREVRVAELFQDPEAPVMKGGVPLMNFIVMEEKTDDFSSVCVDAFVAGISAVFPIV